MPISMLFLPSLMQGLPAVKFQLIHTSWSKSNSYSIISNAIYTKIIPNLHMLAYRYTYTVIIFLQNKDFSTQECYRDYSSYTWLIGTKNSLSTYCLGCSYTHKQCICTCKWRTKDDVAWNMVDFNDMYRIIQDMMRVSSGTNDYW